jgi:hypothetical protein
MKMHNEDSRHGSSEIVSGDPCRDYLMLLVTGSIELSWQ